MNQIIYFLKWRKYFVFEENEKKRKNKSN